MVGVGGETDNRVDPCNNVAVGHVFRSYPLYLINKALEIANAVLSALYLVYDRYNPSLEGVVALSVRNRHDLLLVDLTIRLTHLTVGRYYALHSTDPLTSSTQQLWRPSLRQPRARPHPHHLLAGGQLFLHPHRVVLRRHWLNRQLGLRYDPLGEESRTAGESPGGVIGDMEGLGLVIGG